MRTDGYLLFMSKDSMCIGNLYESLSELANSKGYTSIYINDVDLKHTDSLSAVSAYLTHTSVGNIIEYLQRKDKLPVNIDIYFIDDDYDSCECLATYQDVITKVRGEYKLSGNAKYFNDEIVEYICDLIEK